MPSSVILRMQYIPETHDLIIVFRGGRGTYRYLGVPFEEWTAFRSSPSKGTYLNEVFKAKDYCYQKVENLPPQNQQRHTEEDDQAQQQPQLLQWGEPLTLPKPRPHGSHTGNR